MSIASFRLLLSLVFKVMRLISNNNMLPLHVLVKVWKVVVLSVAVVVTMALVLGIVACWLRKRRNVRNKPRSKYSCLCG